MDNHLLRYVPDTAKALFDRIFAVPGLDASALTYDEVSDLSLLMAQGLVLLRDGRFAYLTMAAAEAQRIADQTPDRIPAPDPAWDER